MDETQKILKIAAKSFRKAKRWYLGYVTSQLAVLAFAIVAIFVEINPSLSAMLAFVGVLCTECIRWRSEYWKDQGEWAKRKWEVADGLGTPIEGREIADWLAAKPAGFLDGVNETEIMGLEFASTLPKGALRLIENVQESAWWSKHECHRLAWYIGIALTVIVIAAFAALAVSIAALKATAVKQSGAALQSVGGVICAVLVFIFSVNLIRLLVQFVSFASAASRALKCCDELLKSPTPSQAETLLSLSEYQIARSAAPLLPTFIWTIHGDHLRAQWAAFRPTQPTAQLAPPPATKPPGNAPQLPLE